MRSTAIGLAFAALAAAGCAAAASSADPVRAAVREKTAQCLFPISIFVGGSGTAKPYGAAAGAADPRAGTPLSPDTPVRIASNTKTFVAVTVLRLWEDGKIDLDSPIRPLLDPQLEILLRNDGYQTDRITVRQLLSHSAGLYDHGSDPRYIKAVLADPSHRWTREEQIRLMTVYADPQSAPGTKFQYSDDDYVLLGNIVERITGKSLAASVREQIGFRRLGLDSTWWETAEQAPSHALRRARQFYNGIDVTNVDPSMDLYGGGGLVASPRDLARFFAALFEGKVFKRPATLKEMLWKGPHEGADQYRLGIFVKRQGDEEVYWHSGFWGTAAYYNPARHIAVAGASTQNVGFQSMRAIVERVAGLPQAQAVGTNEKAPVDPCRG